MSHGAATRQASHAIAADIKAGASVQGQTVSVSDLSGTVEALMHQFQGDAEQITSRVSEEVNELIAFIETAKADIASMQPATLVKRDLPTAADELDAIVDHTEAASNEIMDAADALSEIATMCEGKVAERVEEVATRIYEASSFQDITGQRITKVVKVIKYIEDKLDDLAEAIGDLAGEDGVIVKKDATIDAEGDDALLNGPQLEGEGNSQDDIDALLASFD
ncbi:MAG: protein phosphatase CheZ [Pseudomonadota bacterium]